jgi:lipid-A-disaccharide synthase
MVNLIAGRQVVPELMQGQMTGRRIAAEALRLLRDSSERARMLSGLEEVRRRLSEAGPGEAPRRAAAIIQDILEGQVAHVS